MDGVNTWVVSKAVRAADIKVALSGLGGDELFGGYASFRRARVLSHVRRFPTALRSAVARTGRLLTNGSIRARKCWDLLESPGLARDVYAISRRLFAPEEIQSLVGLQPEPQDLPAATADLMNDVSMLELRGYMTDTLLRDTDSMSMAHSLEVRVPFVDAEVLDLVMQIPGAWKVNGGRPKPMLLDALGGLVPDEVWRRKKVGFQLPFREWMLSSLHAEIDPVLRADSAELQRVGVDQAAASAVWTKFQKEPQGERWTRPWALYVLRQWCECNGVAA